MPLNDGYIHRDEEDERDFDMLRELHGLTQALRERQEASWESIFDLDWDDPEWTSPRDAKSIQAKLWETRLDQVLAWKEVGKAS